MEIRTNTDKRKRYEEYDSGSSRRQQSHRSSYKHSDQRDDELAKSKRYSVERKSYHQTTHRSSQRKSSSDYKTKRDDDPYDRRSQRSRNENAFEDRYDPTEKELT
uniref:U11/U12 small nuclear ribonucleoprotein 48 kDa protein n=3 Tax=Noccaea caerulescens TaxID=107243 RepID=A0A1J3EP14_NOCCA